MADLGDTRGYNKALKTIFELNGNQSSPVLDINGVTLLTEETDIKKRWREYFSQLLNQNSIADASILNKIAQRPVLQSADAPLQLDEVRKAVMSLCSNKSPGLDGIQAEIYQKAGEHIFVALYDVLTAIWNEKVVPQAFKDAAVIPIFKRKGRRQECSNYRGISLLSTATKFSARSSLSVFSPYWIMLSLSHSVASAAPDQPLIRSLP